MDWGSALGFLNQEETAEQEPETAETQTAEAEETAEDVSSSPQPYERLIMASVAQSVVDSVAKSVPELDDPSVKEMTVRALMNMSPEFYTPETVLALMFMHYGIHSLSNQRTQLEETTRQITADPRILLDDPFRQKVEQLAEKWGIDPDELLADYFAELSNKVETGSRVGLFGGR